MLYTAIDALTAKDLEELVANRVSEGTALDYKEALPGNGDEAHRDFLADVSSFANTGGGYMLFGIGEERDAAGQPTGIPAAIRGVTGNLGAEILRLESIV